MTWRMAAGCAGAMAALAVIVALAALAQNGAELVYEQSGNGCRALSGASNHDLEVALLPVRILVVFWVLATGMLLALEGAGQDWRPAAVGVPLLAAAEMVFIGTDALSAAFPLIVLWIISLVMAAMLVTLAVRRRSAWAWLSVAWLAVATVVLPVALVAVSGDGAIRSC